MTKVLIEHWIDELSKPNPKFGGAPTCPFAQKAWRESAVEFEDCGIFLFRSLSHIVAHAVPTGQIYLLSFDTEYYDIDIIELVVENTNKLYPHLLVLATHPDHDEPSHPTLGLVFIQRKADMIEAVEYLSRETEYYKNNTLPEWYY